LEDGVAAKPLPLALSDDYLAVAYRIPNLTPEQAKIARDFALRQHGRYSYGDAAAAGAARLGRGVKEMSADIRSQGGYVAGKVGSYTPNQNRPAPPPTMMRACPAPEPVKPPRVDPYLCAKAGICQPTPVAQKSFFCSQLVLAAFEQAGVSLTPLPASRITPADITDLWLQKKLNYVGHLKIPQQR